MNMPAPLTMAARRAMVEQLLRQEPGISARKIAGRLGAGKDTILRDIDAIEAEQRQRTPEQPAAEPERAPEDDRLVLVLDQPLRQALAVLRAARGVQDSERQNVAVARAAIRALADTFEDAQQNTQKGTTP